MTQPKGYLHLQKQYEALPPTLQKYFQYLPSLLADYPYEVALSYLFARLERGHNMVLYCGAVKLHRADASIMADVIQKQHLTRETFRKLFDAVFGKKIDKNILTSLEAAESVRDRAIHGKEPTDADMRKAISDGV